MENIGQSLEVECSVLKSCSNNPQDDGIKLMTVINNWVDTMPTDVTWEIIIAPIENPIVAHNSTAMKIKELLAKPDICTKNLRKKDFVWYRTFCFFKYFL